MNTSLAAKHRDLYTLKAVMNTSFAAKHHDL
jgi:hypothetical protein